MSMAEDGGPKTTAWLVYCGAAKGRNCHKLPIFLAKKQNEITY